MEVADTSERSTILTVKTAAFRAALSPDGKWLITGDSDGELELRDIGLQGKLVGQKKLAQKPISGIEALTFTPDSKLVVAGGRDGMVTTLRVPNLIEVTRADVSSTVTSLAVSADGEAVAVGTYDEVRLLPIDQLKPAVKTWKCDSPVSSVAFSPDGKLVAVGDWNGAVVLHSRKDEGVLWILKPPNMK